MRIAILAMAIATLGGCVAAPVHIPQVEGLELMPIAPIRHRPDVAPVPAGHQVSIHLAGHYVTQAERALMMAIAIGPVKGKGRGKQ